MRNKLTFCMAQEVEYPSCSQVAGSTPDPDAVPSVYECVQPFSSLAANIANHKACANSV